MAMRRFGAMQWMRLAMAGSVLMAMTAVLCLVRVPVLPVHGDGLWSCVWAYRLRGVVYLLPLAIGLGVLVWAERRFKRGYRDDLWSEAELADVRSLMARRVWTGIAGTILVFWIVGICVQHSMRGAGIWYLLVIPSQTAQRIRQLITPRVERGSGLTDWRKFGPLRSEHWGERSLPGTVD